MQVVWLKNAIKVSEENFNRIVNESLTSVVEKLSLEKSLYFAWQNKRKRADVKSKSIETGNLTSRNKAKKISGSPDLLKKRNKTYNIKLGKGTNGKVNQYQYVHTTNFDSVAVNALKNNYLHDHLWLNNITHSNELLIKSDRLDSISDEVIRKVIKFPATEAISWSFIDTIKQSIYVIGKDTSSKFIISISESVDSAHIDDIEVNSSETFLVTSSGTYINTSDIKVDSISNFLSVEMNDNYPKHLIVKSDEDNENEKQDEVITVSKDVIRTREKEHDQAIDQLVFEMDSREIKLEDRIDPVGVGELLRAELTNRGLANPFEYALVSMDSARRIAYSTNGFGTGNPEFSYKTNLFPRNIIPLNDFIEVSFPDKRNSIYKAVLLPISISGFFTLIVLLTFSITLITIIRQKKLADMKADFINNMTHELKTPIATINLATDSIDNPKVVGKPETIKYFTSVIREENTRMNKLVESVLQTARLERKTLKLNLKQVDLKGLISKIAKQMSVLVANKGGVVHTNLPETPVEMIADENLMENIIFNLIDNALKYCNHAPLIVITLKVLPGGVSISVEDNGIGISRSDQQKVFEKFYRVPQGDVHNVKGFGLGLSNVKEITELHNGMVQLKSEPGKGSTFTLYFPFNTNGNG